MEHMICAGALCHNIAFAVLAVFPRVFGTHHPHPFITHISSRIGPATMQAFKSRAIRRDGFIRAEDARGGAECQLSG